MSAAIVQKNIYFECGDKHFSENNTTDNKSIDGRCENFVYTKNLMPSLEGVNSNSMCQKLYRHDQKDSDPYRLHGTLTRTISQPQHEVNVTSLVCTLIENLGNMNLHRKLERTQSEPIPQHVNTSRYKTELCRPFEEAGECKYGEKCQFAHGYHELRNLQRHPKYKTEYCRTFHSVGFCPYGPRCHFVHNADEARALQQQQNHSSLNNSVSTYPLNCNDHRRPYQSDLTHSLPLSPPLSMSTGSDRESPTGSLSLSPTNSIMSFPFSEQISPTISSLHANFSYIHTPPESPNASISPVNTPPPITSGAIQNKNHDFIKPISKQTSDQVISQGNRSIPISIIRDASSISAKTTLSSLSSDDARLPVFNRLSCISAVENISDLSS